MGGAQRRGPFVRLALGLAVFVIAWAGPAWAAAAATTHRQKPRCSARHPMVRSGRVLVYERFIKKLFTYGVYACWAPRGKPRLLGRSDPMAGEYGPNNELVGNPLASGSYVAADFASGEASLVACAKYEPPNYPCPKPTQRVSVVNVGSGRTASFPIALANPTWAPTTIPTAVSAAGAVAWIDERGLVATSLQPQGKQLHGNPQMLDPDAVGLTSITGLTVNWYDVVNGTQVDHSAAVPPG